MYLFRFNGFNTHHHVFFADVGPYLTPAAQQRNCEVQVVRPGQNSDAFRQCAYA